jgi:hypothetical protein
LPIVLVLFASAVCIKRFADSRELQRRLQACKAAGRPLTLAELAARYPEPPPQKDARPMLAPAAKIEIPYDTSRAQRTGPLTKAYVREAKALLATNESVLTKIPWERLDGSWFGYMYANGRQAPNKVRLTELGDLARLLCMEAILQAEDERPAEAFKALGKATLVNATVRNETSLYVSYRWRTAERNSLAIERVLNRVQPRDEDLREFPVHGLPTEIGAAQECLVTNDLPFCLDLVQEIQQSKAQLTAGVIAPWRLALRAYTADFLYHDADFLYYMDYLDHVQEALQMPRSQSIPKLDAYFKVISHHVSYAGWPLNPINAFRRNRPSVVWMFLPRCEDITDNETVVVAHARMNVCALAIERWHIVHGHFPEELSQLVPQYLPSVPVDPYDGKPFGYNRNDHGYTLTSEQMSYDKAKVRFTVERVGRIGEKPTEEP